MSESEIVLSGNFFIDLQILPNSVIEFGANHKAKSKITFGGILNVSRYLEILNIQHITSYTVGSDSAVRANLENLHTHSTHIKDNQDGLSDLAIIVLDELKNSRTSFVVDGVSRQHKLNHELNSRLHHISYLDNLPNFGIDSLKILREKGCLISADLCLRFPSHAESNELMNRIEFVDYLIISDSEFEAYFGSIELELFFAKKSYTHLKIIIHRRDGFSVIDSSGSKTETIPVKPIGNVLGAGDCFVAFFLRNVLLNLSLYEVVKKTFLETSDFLLKERI
jgi:sugar/nucleoside kinase (ribokinase family)